METFTTSQKRFVKRSQDAEDVRRRPFHCLCAVFTNFHFEDLQNELAQWQRLAISNEMSVYSSGESREDLMDFCDEFLKMINVLQQMLQHHEEAQGVSHEYSRSGLELSPEESLNSLKSFFDRFDPNYCRTEIFDMLDAVITYSGERELYKGNILAFYKCLETLLAVGFVLTVEYSTGKRTVESSRQKTY